MVAPFSWLEYPMYFNYNIMYSCFLNLEAAATSRMDRIELERLLKTLYYYYIERQEITNMIYLYNIN